MFQRLPPFFLSVSVAFLSFQPISASFFFCECRWCFTGKMKYSFNFDSTNNDHYCPTSFILLCIGMRFFSLSHSHSAILFFDFHIKWHIMKKSTKICMKIASRSCRKYQRHMHIEHRMKRKSWTALSKFSNNIENAIAAFACDVSKCCGSATTTSNQRSNKKSV